MNNTEIFIVTIWAIGSVVAVGGALTMMLIARSKWSRLGYDEILVKGEGPPHQEQVDAIKFFLKRWSYSMSVKGLRIEWVPGDWFMVRKVKAAGSAPNGDYVKCAAGAGIRVLFHELAHIYCYREHNDPDFNHDNQLMWDRVYAIQQEWDMNAETRRWSTD